MRSVLLWRVHHSQHLRSAGHHETDDEDYREYEKDDVHYARVVERDRRSGNCRRAMRRNESERLEEELDDECRSGHGGIERCQQKYRYPPAVVLSMDVEHRQHDQVGINEGDRSTEADAAIPQHRRERNVADRADERHDGDQWPDEWTPDPSRNSG